MTSEALEPRNGKVNTDFVHTNLKKLEFTFFQCGVDSLRMTLLKFLEEKFKLTVTTFYNSDSYDQLFMITKSHPRLSEFTIGAKSLQLNVETSKR